jgi:hypothetical protein
MSGTSNISSVYKEALREFELAWSNPQFTQIELPPVEVNRVLREKYVASPAVSLSRSMVWDMELKKAWDPLTYIPYVVSEGRSWGRHLIDRGIERFSRSSIQDSWLNVGRGRVLEDVFVDYLQSKILFLGRKQLLHEDILLEADAYQPLFHVEHAAGGTETDPLNLWRIVILTDQKDERYERPFAEMAQRGMLPGFLEIYIERDLRVKLNRNQA